MNIKFKSKYLFVFKMEQFFQENPSGNQQLLVNSTYQLNFNSRIISWFLLYLQLNKKVLLQDLGSTGNF